MESSGAYVDDPLSRDHFYFVPVFFRTALQCSGGYHLERGGMRLHDAIGVNCENGGTT